MTEFPFKEGYTTPAGQVVLKFEGAETKRTSKSYPYLVAFVSPSRFKWHSPSHGYVACLPQVIITKGTGDYKTAIRAKDKTGRGAVILMRRAGGIYKEY